MDSVKAPVAPLDGVLRYPRDTLLSLVRSILKANEERYIDLRSAAEEKEDEKEEEDLNYAIEKITFVVFELDSARWKANGERNQPGRVWNAAALQHFADSNAAERALFNMNVNQHKFEWVINDSVKFRRDNRGQPPSEDAKWAKEDALLDLLQFLAKCGHEGLFQPADDR